MNNVHRGHIQGVPKEAESVKTIMHLMKLDLVIIHSSGICLTILHFYELVLCVQNTQNKLLSGLFQLLIYLRKFIMYTYNYLCGFRCYSNTL